ncbi:SusC/RagA family TonB-linked outer membrane protein [Sphingobacterium sp. 2149]|uniref:SusC/RagA family TonB-linked outer membrane protein n=1 Tax=Sphingobacterium sp. 2149 TaxID=2817763 RepID=UPI00286004BE|nr:SusC/RagA family TonB-linked outer membrane protein [Sphingobacterium sp. 2149]MDR6734503.1 TonB-linked SusC/RagA family outer membrane protein [Sphingobacterium sp. 2149]
MKTFFYFFILLSLPLLTSAQQTRKIRVLDSNDRPIPNVNIRLMPQNKVLKTDDLGYFSFVQDGQKQIEASAIGYSRQIVSLLSDPAITVIRLKATSVQLDEAIVNTGYYRSDKRNLPGSFVQIDQKLLQRNPSPNIIERMEGITSGLQFDRRTNFNENTIKPSLRLRGVVSIESNSEPLIILDNFPYTGDLNQINPDDIESITVLKDASAAAIWGAKAGNGVIVLTSKKGINNTPLKLTFSASSTLKERPDLFYNRNYIPSADRVDLEQTLFDRGFYNRANPTLLPGVAALNFKYKDGLIDLSTLEQQKEILRNRDVREQAQEHLYRMSWLQRYNLQLKAGGSNFNYLLSAGFDQNNLNIVGDRDRRYTFSLNTEYNLLKKLMLNTNIRLNMNQSIHNGYSLSDLNYTRNLDGYTAFVDCDGAALPINYRYFSSYIENAEKNGLLDWSFSPIEDRNQQDLNATNRNLLLGTGLSYEIISGLNLSLKYQFQQGINTTRNLYKKDSYLVHDLVNRFTQADGTYIIPLGAILDQNNGSDQSYNWRGQLNYSRNFLKRHQINALAGAELSENKTIAEAGSRLYGYNSDNLSYQTSFDYTKYYPVRPEGSGLIPTNTATTMELTNRYISYYGNLNYVFDKMHTVSLSTRWDASNLFGVKTNQKGVPLWSIGVNEDLKNSLKLTPNWISRLNLRASYGVTGNVVNKISALPTAYVATFVFPNSLPSATLSSAGNPSLKWERINIINLGLDFAVLNGRIRGTIDYYSKDGNDLIGESFLDPTTGIFTSNGVSNVDNRINYANMITKGLDLNLSANILQGNFRWDANLLWSYTTNKVTNYMANTAVKTSSFVSSPRPREGHSLDEIYAYPFGGLDPATGMVLTPPGNRDYTGYFNSISIDDLILVGRSFPPYQGSIRNTFTYKNFGLSFLIQWKNGFYFRRKSIDYAKLFQNSIGNIDYLDRWQKPGDENITIVPALPSDVNANRDSYYANVSPLVVKGDFIKLSDIRLDYNFAFKSPRGASIGLFAQYNGGLILYRSNKFGIDPDAVNSSYPIPNAYSIGIHLNY